MNNTIEYVILTALMASFLGGCGKSLMNVEQESQAIWEVRLAVQKALCTEDTDAMMKLWADDVIFRQPNGRLCKGKQEIRQSHEELFEMFDDFQIDFKRLAINFPTPDVAVEEASYDFSATGFKNRGRDTTVLVKRNGRWLITAVSDFVLQTPAESTSGQIEINNQDDIKAIRKLINDFCAAHKYDDGAKLAEFYSDDAMLMPPGEPMVFGKQAIASRYQQDIKKFTAELTTTPDEIEVSGNLAFVRGTFTIRLTPKTEGDKIEATFKFIEILRKGTNGSWKPYCDIWNSDAPLPPKPKDLTIVPPHQFELIPAENPKKVSEGIYQVGWIRASLPSDESHVQMIPVQMDEPDNNWPQWGLNRQDINFDGYLDIGVCQHGGAKWGRFHWCLYDPDKMEFYTNALTKELSELTCADLKADPKTKRIKRTQFFGAQIKEYTYEIVNGHLRLSQSQPLGE